jgi:hypothetical protein
MKPKIDKNVPIPENSGRNKYPWVKLEVGDSFVCPKDISSAAFQSSGRQWAKRNKVKFVFRNTDEGCRVWRTK